ncbi:MAG: 3',5'-cyclic-AMP phosphodiesterase [Gammaproteobacteria bacterium]|nr:3',5'-cyclic-AMP phosphodiesterase [Gammaproteobacteria bacterium]
MSLSDGVKFIQISDSHLFDSADKNLIGVNTDESLRAIISLVEQETNVSGILATGDLSQDSSLASYQRFEKIVSKLDLPVYWLPGNHDNPDYFHNSPENFPLPGRSLIETECWRILMLDSVIPGDESGHLASSELDYIDENVKADGKHHLLLLHHQPVPCGTAWLDTMKLDNSDELLQVIASKPSIRAVIHGHIHHEVEHRIANIRYISTPSTCFQFTPGTDDFSLDTRLPGYRSLTLMDDGSIETEVVRLTDFDLNLEDTVGGY